MRPCLEGEFSFRTSRASGPGGQHVNRTASRVELVWNLEASACLDPVQKNRLRTSLASRLTKKGDLILVSDQHRSQHRNRQEVVLRFFLLLDAGLRPRARRIPTRASRASQERRVKQKKIRGEIKRTRGRFRGED